MTNSITYIENSASLGDFNDRLGNLIERWEIDPGLLPDLPSASTD
jgi:hypothetical protein